MRPLTVLALLATALADRRLIDAAITKDARRQADQAHARVFMYQLSTKVKA